MSEEKKIWEKKGMTEEMGMEDPFSKESCIFNLRA
jgi:hypothetical protein